MKKLTINIEESPRELATEKSVCDIVSDYAELDERVLFTLINSTKNEKKEFSLEDFNQENDGLTRKEFISKVNELVIEKCIVNTGRELAYQDENGNQKTRIEKLPKYTLVKMII